MLTRLCPSVSPLLPASLFSARSSRLSSFTRLALAALAVTVATACSNGGGTDGRGNATSDGGDESANFDCDGSCANQSLSAADVELIVRQAVGASTTAGVSATVAIVDRVGNVLALYQMPGAAPNVVINGQIGASGGLEAAPPIPSTIAAISKAGTGAYLSSQGNAFSTRTASQIVQEHFDPQEDLGPGGPLFGVQFSQLICGDVTVLNPGLAGGIPSGRKPKAGGLIGPRPLPLGLSADPGGFPLYKNGDLVGGIGVELDGAYTLDRSIRDIDKNIEEQVAIAASTGFRAPSQRTANNIIIGGRTLRYADVSRDDIPALPDPLPAFDPTGLRALTFYTDGSVRDGATFGTPASGYADTVRAGVPAAILVDGSGNARFPTRRGSSLAGGVELQPNEVDAILDSALLTAHRSRAAIRRPLDSSVRVSIFVVDTNGTPIGFVRTQDAPVFGTDVSLQKARTSLFFSAPDAGTALRQIQAGNAVGGFEDYAGKTDAFTGASILTGGFAVTVRAVGNLARPFYPDGVNFNANGPLSLPFPGQGASARTWSVFNDGLQLDLVFQRLVQPLGIPANPPAAVPDSCADERFGDRLRNGIQIFAGSVPLYRGHTLIGAIGISGDGIDQDDMMAFLGASRKGLDFAGHTDVGDPAVGFNAPFDIRCDLVQPAGFPETRLRYVNCPEGPFIGSNEQNVCDSQ